MMNRARARSLLPRWHVAGGIAAIALGIVLTTAADHPHGDPSLEQAISPLRASLRRVRPAPPASPREAQRVALGRQLFFDTLLSGRGDLSCASCHDPRNGWTDTLRTARGTGGTILSRRTPTLFDLGTAAAFFWDGRAESLEQQAMGPVTSIGEMNLPIEELQRRLAASANYRAASFAIHADSILTPDRAAEALAAFERTIASPESAFDRWTDGDVNAIGDDAKRGLLLFTGKGRCASCHSGWRFTDDSFHDIGTVTDDRGRGAILEGIDLAQYAFKTPTLRGVVNRGPYLHNGSEPDLASVVRLYNDGGRVRRPSLSEEIRPLGLTNAEQRDLLAFLNTLGDARAAGAAHSHTHTP